MIVTVNFPIKTYDVDYAGHVSNITYIRWLEDLRLELLERTIPLRELLDRNQAPILLRTEIDYVRQARLPQTVVGRMWIIKARCVRATLSADFAIVETDDITARAQQVVCLVDVQSGRPIRLPETVLRFVE